MGRCERAGVTWKEIFNRAVVEMQLEGLDDVQTAAGIITQCRISFPRSSGYAPNHSGCLDLLESDFKTSWIATQQRQAREP